jgi:hypothetical protein
LGEKGGKRAVVNSPIRIEEAWREGLDAIARTDGIEHQPHKPDGANGEGGIRTRGTVARTLVFETSSFSHSDTSPTGRYLNSYLKHGRAMTPGQVAVIVIHRSFALARPRKYVRDENGNVVDGVSFHKRGGFYIINADGQRE